MLALLPFLIIGLGVSAGVCLSAGYTGLMLAGMLLLVFLAAVVGALVLFLLIAAVMALFVDTGKPQPKQAPVHTAIVNVWLGLLTAFARIRLHVSGTEKLPEGRWLLVCNHRSGFDPIVTGWALRRYGMVFISKPEIFRIPVVGRMIHKAGYLPIDRENDRAALRTILAAAERIRAGDISYGIYPEGTRHREAEMLPFHLGSFNIAQKAGAPIVIAAIRGTDEVKKNFPLRATDVRLEICGVMDAETVKASKTTEIGEVVRQCITSANT